METMGVPSRATDLRSSEDDEGCFGGVGSRFSSDLRFLLRSMRDKNLDFFFDSFGTDCTAASSACTVAMVEV
jgi:hypothetical protein